MTLPLIYLSLLFSSLVTSENFNDIITISPSEYKDQVPEGLSNASNHAWPTLVPAAFGGETQYEFILAALDTTRLSPQLRFEIHPGNLQDVNVFLNLTITYLPRISRKPVVVLHWPGKLTDFLPQIQIKEIYFSLAQKIQDNDYSLLTSELHVIFASGKNFYICDLLGYYNQGLLSNIFCFDGMPQSSFQSDMFFSHHPVSIRRRNFFGRTLRVIAQYDASYEERISIREYPNGTVEFTKGMCLDLLITMQMFLNFSYVSMKGNGWAGLLPNGTWTGMAAQLINNEADLSIAQASMLLMINELKGVSFLHSTSAGQFVALFQQPNRNSDRRLLSSVLSNHTWISCCFTWVAIIGVMYGVLYVRNKLFILDEREESQRISIVFWAFTTATMRGWSQHPTNPSLRVIWLTASLFAFCSYNGFSAGLTVNLVTEVLPVKNYQELSSSKLEVFTDKWLPAAKHLIEKIYKMRGVEVPTDNSNLFTISEGLPQVIQGKHPIAFVTFADAVTSVFGRLNLSDHFFCETVSFVPVADQAPSAMFVKRGSPLKEALNFNILKVTETGILRRINMNYDTNTQIRCPQEDLSYRGGLALDDLWTPCLILFAGFGLCVANWSCETVYFRHFVEKQTRALS